MGELLIEMRNLSKVFRRDSVEVMFCATSTSGFTPAISSA